MYSFEVYLLYYDLPILLNTQQPIYVVKDWQKVTDDNVFMELKDGLRFEPNLQRFLIDETAFSQMMKSQQHMLIIVPKDSDIPDNLKHSVYQIATYHNFTVWQK